MHLQVVGLPGLGLEQDQAIAAGLQEGAPADPWQATGLATCRGNVGVQSKKAHLSTVMYSSGGQAKLWTLDGQNLLPFLASGLSL